MNRHNDHDASCLCCAHLWVDEGEPGYSEYTPSTPASFRCLEDCWKFKLYLTDKEVVPSLHAGLECEKFTPKKDK